VETATDPVPIARHANGKAKKHMLRQEIDNAKRIVNTDSVQITLGEVANMYTSGELNILPEFQRLFRWTIDRKSNFVESIFVGIPIPPVFVFEDADGNWELIDGLQRISTVLEFMGILRDPETDAPMRSVLMKTKYLPSLEGTAWEVVAEGETSLEKALQLFFRRARVDFQILKHPSDPKTKFDLFQRLNRGGAYATEQEVRTCSMVLSDSEFTKDVRKFAEQAAFQAMFRVGAEQKKGQKDIEYLVRLMVHCHYDLSKRVDVQEFLSYGILDLIQDKVHFDALDTAGWVIQILHDALGDDALIPPEERAAGISARFSLRALEGIAVGVARNRARIMALQEPAEFVRERVEGFWQQAEVVEMSAAGLRGTSRIQKSIPFGERWFNPDDPL